jgi:hypothetical protein
MHVCIWFCWGSARFSALPALRFQAPACRFATGRSTQVFFTPGVVAAVGGLLLIGLGLALRTLQQIERALAARPMLRVVQEPIAVSAGASDESGEAHILAFPPQTSQVAAPRAVAARTSDDEPAHAPAEALPETTRIGNRSYPPLTKAAGAAPGEANAETDTQVFGRRSNGTAPTRIPPRLPISARSTAATERSRSPALDTVWPKGSRSLRGAQSEPVQVGRTMEPQHTTEEAADYRSTHNTAPNTLQSTMQSLASPAATAYDEPVPISVLRSGIVDGMAYTLYSDGSIEAQLPQGTLRFGSITELRQHLEQGA